MDPRTLQSTFAVLRTGPAGHHAFAGSAFALVEGNRPPMLRMPQGYLVANTDVAAAALQAAGAGWRITVAIPSWTHGSDADGDALRPLTLAVDRVVESPGDGLALAVLAPLDEIAADCGMIVPLCLYEMEEAVWRGEADDRGWTEGTPVATVGYPGRRDWLREIRLRRGWPAMRAGVLSRMQGWLHEADDRIEAQIGDPERGIGGDGASPVFIVQGAGREARHRLLGVVCADVGEAGATRRVMPVAELAALLRRPPKEEAAERAG